MMNTNEDIFYYIGKWMFVPIITVCIIMNIINPETLSVLPGCVFLKYVKLPCPGCGGTRAVYHLANGHFLTALGYHPFVVYTAAVYVCFMAVCFWRRHFAKKKSKPIQLENYVYVGIGILLLQYVLKLGIILA